MHALECKLELLGDEQDDDTDHIPIRVLLIGSSDVGKTSMMEKAIHHIFPHNVLTGLEHTYRTQVQWTDHLEQTQDIHLEFIDPPHGQDTFDDHRYDDMDCLIIMFSIIDQHSFDDISTKWMHYIECRWRKTLGDMVLLLVATHADSPQNAQIKHIDIRKLRRYYQLDADFEMDTPSPFATGRFRNKWHQIVQSIVARHHQIKINHGASKLHTNMPCIDSFSNYYYDRLAVLISILDLITDIIVMVQFYNNNQKVFFVLSVIILVLCQFAYANAFVVLFAMNHSPAKRTIVYFCALLIGPFLSTLIWYILDHPHSLFVKHVLRDKLGVTVKLWNVDGQHSAFAQWVRVKLKKHLGFLLQSILESAPQSILQMIAIVYYGNRPNVITICSILLSMISIATKSIILSRAIDVKTFIFNWFCCVVDFFSIFVAVSWIFYNVNTTPVHSISDFISLFTLIGQIFWYKLLFCVFPAVCVGVIGLSIYCGYVGIKENISFWRLYKEKRIEQYKDKMQMHVIIERDDIETPCSFKAVLLFQFMCHQMGIVLLIIVLCACGIVMGTIIAEMLCFTPIAFLLYKCIAIKFPHEKAADYDGWNDIFRFVSSYHDTHDRLLRCMSVQHMMLYLSFKPILGRTKKQFQMFLRQEEIQSVPFKDATFTALREHMSFSFRSIINQTFCNLIEYIQEQEEWIGRAKIICIVLYCVIFVQIYVLSRVLNILFPVIICGYLWYFNLWSATSVFQYCMLLMYVVLLLLWFIAAKQVFVLHHTMFHITLVANRWMLEESKKDKYDALLTNVNQYYEECICVSERRHILWNHFGDDVAFAIDSFVPRFDIWNDQL